MFDISNRKHLKMKHLWKSTDCFCTVNQNKCPYNPKLFPKIAASVILERKLVKEIKKKKRKKEKYFQFRVRVPLY